MCCRFISNILFEHAFLHACYVHSCVFHPVIAFDYYFHVFLLDLYISFLQSFLFSSHTLLNCISQSSPHFLQLAVHLPSSRVVALISVLDGPVPALLKAWTTTPYWANFFRLSKVYTSLSPVAFISTMLYWPLLPGPFSLYPIW